MKFSSALASDRIGKPEERNEFSPPSTERVPNATKQDPASKSCNDLGAYYLRLRCPYS